MTEPLVTTVEGFTDFNLSLESSNQDTGLILPVLQDDVLNSYAGASQKTFHMAAVGVSFVQKRNPEYIDAVNNGDYAVLVAELSNESDATAVGVVHNMTGKRVAYVKRELAGEIWNNIVKNGDLYLAKIELTGGTKEKENLGMNLKIIRMFHAPEPKKSAKVKTPKSLGELTGNKSDE